MNDTPSRFRGKSVFRDVLLWWVVVMVLTGCFFWGLRALSPWILEEDQEQSHWKLYATALGKINEWDHSRWSPDQEKRKRLLDEASEYLGRACRMRPDSKNYLWLWGVTLYNRALMENPPDQVKLEKALGKIEQVWNMSGETSSKAGRLLAKEFLREKRYSESKKILRRLLRLSPENPETYDILYELEIEERELRQAVKVLDLKASKSLLSPDDRKNLGRLLLRLGDYERARKTFETSVRDGIGGAQEQLLWGIALLGVGNLKEGIHRLHLYNQTLAPGENWPAAETLGLDRFPSELFPVVAYSCLEGRP